MLIGELAAKTSCSVRAIRHYEQSGLLFSVRSENGYRQYEQAAVEHVMRIRVLLRNGFTIDEIRPVASMHEASLRSRGLVCADVIALYQSKIDEIDTRIHELADIRDRARHRLQELIDQRERVD